jgi:hypothetical protein
MESKRATNPTQQQTSDRSKRATDVVMFLFFGLRFELRASTLFLQPLPASFRCAWHPGRQLPVQNIVHISGVQNNSLFDSALPPGP